MKLAQGVRGALTGAMIVALCIATLGGGCQEVMRFANIFAKDCGAELVPGYYDVRKAIHDGGPDWVSVVADAGKCIAPIVIDELSDHGCHMDGWKINCTGAPATTTVAGPIQPPRTPPTDQELFRARVALMFAREGISK